MPFREIIFNLFGERLNLMLSEIFQLSEESLNKIKFCSHAKIIEIILIEISKGEIKSAHISKEKAINFLKFLKRIMEDDFHHDYGADAENDGRRILQ